MEKKLNMGCGRDYKKGWINLDMGDEDAYGNKIKVDVAHDLNKFPYPFPDNYFSEIWADQVLEHLDEPIRVVRELVRISKKNAKITIRVPHFSYFKSFGEPTHKHFFSFFSIDMIPNHRCEVKREFCGSDNVVVNFISRFFTMSPAFYERFLYGFFPVQTVIWTLKVKK